MVAEPILAPPCVRDTVRVEDEPVAGAEHDLLPRPRRGLERPEQRAGAAERLRARVVAHQDGQRVAGAEHAGARGPAVVVQYATSSRRIRPTLSAASAAPGSPVSIAAVRSV